MRLKVSATRMLVCVLFGMACRGSSPSETTSRTRAVVNDTTRVGTLARDSTNRAPAVRDPAAVARSFRDTALASVTFADAQTFQLRTPGQRDALRATLKTQRDLWRAQTPREYQYLLHVDCFCPGRRGWLLIEVRRGQPLRAWDKTGKTVALSDWNTFSIDDLFAMLERAVNMDGVVHLAFDPRWHFPANVRTVRQPGPDAWTIIDARALRPLPDK